MKISFERTNLLYPGCIVNGVQEFYHPVRKWTSLLNNGTKIIASGLSPEKQVEEAIKEGALVVQLQIQHEGAIHHPDYRVEQLQEAL